MYLLQKSHVTANLSNVVFEGYLTMFIMYAIPCLLAFFIIKAAVQYATKKQQANTETTNKLLAELLRNNGVSADRIDQLMKNSN